MAPTNESAVNHIKSAHLQTLIWCSADRDEPPNLDITKYGWQIDENYITQPLYGSCVAAPASLLNVIACYCKFTSPCSKMHGSCRSSGLICTSYCKCDNETCCNQTPTVDTSDDDDETNPE